MNRNMLLIAIAMVGVCAGAFGYWLYAERHRAGVEITIGRSGVSVQGR
jgi:hypothetical protein